MSENYQPTNWYWDVAGSVAGSPNEVWSSASKSYVSTTDPTYLAWVAEGNTATEVATEDELQAVLNKQYVAGTPQEFVTTSDESEVRTADYMAEIRNIVVNPQGLIPSTYGSSTVTDTSLTEIANWYALVESGSILCTSSEAPTPETFPSGILLSAFLTSASFGIAQAIREDIVFDLNGAAMAASCRLIASSLGSQITVGLAILADTSTSGNTDLVNDWNSTTYTAGNFFTSANSLQVLGTDVRSNVTQDKEVRLSIECTPSSGGPTTYYVFLWAQTSGSIDEQVLVSEFQLERGDIVGPFTPRPRGLEESLTRTSPINYQSFTSSGTGQTWTDPAVGTIVYIRLWGGGGSGGVRTTTGSASGGGGGAYAEYWVKKSDISGNKLVNVAAGGAAVASSNAVGNPGGTSAFDTAGLNLRAFGGGGGFHTAVSNLCHGGRGGSHNAVGAVGSGAGNSYIGGMLGSVYALQPSGGAILQESYSAFYSAGGANISAANAGADGGNSVHGGAGGGSTCSTGPVNTAGGSSIRGGSGGTVTTGTGVAGTAPGGGGGASRNGAASGAGGVGKVEVWVF